MTDDLKKVFDGIRAEDKLKTDTMLYLQDEIRKRGAAQSSVSGRRFAAALVSIVVILLSGVFSYSLYFTPSSYVDLDVNPSVELTLNQFDLVIGAHAYNEDGKSILSGLSIKHKNYEAALIQLIEAINRGGYIQSGGLVSVTLQTNTTVKEAKLLANIQTGVTDYIAEHHNGTQVDIFSVSSDTRGHAYEEGVSPAKYLAIQEFIEINPAATVESCRDESISDIRKLTREHGRNHHSSDNYNEEPIGDDKGGKDEENSELAGEDDGNDEESNNSQAEDAQDIGQGEGHHGNSNGHNGGGHE